jgi:hypothetical protein
MLHGVQALALVACAGSTAAIAQTAQPAGPDMVLPELTLPQAPPPTNAYSGELMLGTTTAPFIVDEDAGGVALPGERNRQDRLLARERYASRVPGEPRAISVLERRRPEFDPIGFSVGGFRLFPELTLGGGGTTDAPRGGGADAFGHLRAAGVLRSQWGRHELALDGFADQRLYARNSDGNALAWLARGSGRLDVHDEDFVKGEAAVQRVVESRGTIGEIARTRSGNAHVRKSAEITGSMTRGRFVGKLRTGYEDYSYADVRLDDGTRVDQSFRNHRGYAIGGEVQYGFGGDFQSAFVSATKSWRRYDELSSPRRDVDELELLAGFRGEITPLLRGQLALGYISADFQDPAVGSRHALGIDTRLQYLPTELTTLNFSATRKTRNVASARTPEAILTRFTFGADHELRRNLIISGSLLYENADYVESLAREHLIGAEASADLFANRNWRTKTRIGYVRRVSSGTPTNRDFDGGTLSVDVNYRF